MLQKQHKFVIHVIRYDFVVKKIAWYSIFLSYKSEMLKHFHKLVSLYPVNINLWSLNFIS